MIDILPNIRSYLLSDAVFANRLSPYLTSKALFTRVPVPTDAKYPLAVISPLVAELERDFIDKPMRTITHDLVIYDTNDSADSYRNVEAAAFRAFELLNLASFAMPTGYTLVMCKARSPIPSATDDLVKVARVVTVELIITKS